MYQIENSGDLIKSSKKLRAGWTHWPHVSRTVLLLGLTSFFTDVSSEMVSSILPLYMILTLRMAPLEFGIIDGLYQGTASFVRVASGYIADRWYRYKEVAIAGYALSAVCKLGILLAGSVFGTLTSLIVMDRTGKGIRTAPRDALISLSSPQERLATAFGVHRALDTAGAMLGPIISLGLLELAPGAFDAIFVVSFCAALVGLGVLMLFVENQRPDAPAATVPAVSLREVSRLLHLTPFRTLMLIGAALSLVTISDGFLYLTCIPHIVVRVGAAVFVKTYPLAMLTLRMTRL